MVSSRGRWPRILSTGAMILMVLASCAAAAFAVVTFDAKLDPGVVPLGRHSVLTVTLSGDAANLPDVQAPVLAGAEVSGGGTSQSYQMSGSSVSITKSWTWLIAPHGMTDVDIPPFEVVIDGTTHRTQALKLRVDAAAAVPAADGGTSAPSGIPGDDEPAPDQPGPGDERFVTLAMDKDRAHVGEQIVLTFRYYENVASRGFDRPEYTPPRTEGFWRENLGETETYRERRGGVLYQVSRIRYSLVPTRPGELIVEPARVVLPHDVFSDFFANNRRSRGGVRELWTNSLQVHVDDLPAPIPDDYSGLVGSDVSLRAVLDREIVPRGEAVSVTIELVGDGSLKNVHLPAWDLSDDFTIHEAGGSVDQRPVDGRLRGAMRQERILQPKQEGTWTLPPIQMSYFDTGENRFLRVSSKPLTLTVTPSDLPATGDSAGSSHRRALERLGEDLAFVKTPSGVVAARTVPFVETRLWWFVVMAPLILLLIWRYILARKDAELRDPVGRRRRFALTTALGLLAASRKASDPAVRAECVQKGILGFVADRLGSPRAAVGRGDLIDLGAMCGADAAATRLVEILGICELARFGSVGGSGNVTDEILDDAERSLQVLASSVGSGLRRGTRVQGWLLPLAVSSALLGAADLHAAPDPDRLTAEGVQAYTNGELDLARDLFARADSLTGDPIVTFDLATTCARQGDLGAAMLYLERASRGRPRDGDIATNLDHVRNRLADSEQSGGTTAAVAFLVGLLSRWTVDEWAVVVAILAWLVTCGVAHAWWRGFLAVWQRRVLVGGGVALLIASAVLAGRWYDERKIVHAVVLVDEVAVRSGPETSFPVLFEAHAGLALRIEDEREGWSQVTLGGEWRGWLPAASVAAVDRNHELHRRAER